MSNLRKALKSALVQGRLSEAKSAQQALGGLDWFGFHSGLLKGSARGVSVQISLVDGDYVEGAKFRHPDGSELPYKPGSTTWRVYVNRKQVFGAKLFRTAGDAQHAVVDYLKKQGLI